MSYQRFKKKKKEERKIESFEEIISILRETYKEDLNELDVFFCYKINPNNQLIFQHINYPHP